MTASSSDFATVSAPGSARSRAMSAEASRTTLVTLGLGAAVLQYLFGQADIRWCQLGKISLRFRKGLLSGLDVQTQGIVNDDDGVAFSDVKALPRFCQKDDTSRCIYFEVVDLSLALHGNDSLEWWLVGLVRVLWQISSLRATRKCRAVFPCIWGALRDPRSGVFPYVRNRIITRCG